MRTARVALALPLTFLLAALALLPACDPKEGRACSGNRASCVDPANGIFCVDGVYKKLACRGPKGCYSDALNIRCEQTLAEPGDICTSEGAACSPDHHAYLSCKAGTFQKKADCLGPKSCFQEGTQIHCDESEGKPGDLCSNEGAACSTDHAAFLHCDKEHYVLDRKCRGPKGCYHEGTQVRCDGSVAEAGDKCEGGGACTVDKKSFLSCKDGKFEARPCRGDKGCYAEGTMVKCDESVSLPGDACSANTAACSEDKKKFLGCKDDKRFVLRACPRGCSHEGDKIICK